ncbi:MAG: 50S ribosomal protein L10 [Bacteroidia bacterium]|jgi:large subunit ribosomal protein L10|nr:MAG: 50S ribosomal protein L10 [Bacteroidia bacterium]
MTQAEKTALIQELAGILREAPGFYLINLGPLNAEQTQRFRRTMYEKGLRIRVVKNTLVAKALQKAEIPQADLFEPALHYNTALIVCGPDPKVPAQILEAFRKELQKDYPSLKAAYVEGTHFIGEQYLEALTRLKSKQDLLGELIARLQSPIQQVVSALQSGGQTLAGALKTLSEKKS